MTRRDDLLVVVFRGVTGSRPWGLVGFTYATVIPRQLNLGVLEANLGTTSGASPAVLLLQILPTVDNRLLQGGGLLPSLKCSGSRSFSKS